METPSASTQPRPSRPPNRRKFNKEFDLARLKRSSGTRSAAHRPHHGETALKFTAVAHGLNLSGALPSRTRNKHCNYRFKLLLSQWKRDDRKRSLTSGGGEEYGEFEQLCQDICTEIEDYKAQREAIRNEAKEKEDALLVDGNAIRTLAMNRSSTINGREGSHKDEASLSGQETPNKKCKTNPNHMNESFSKAIDALDSAEESRIMLAERQDERDKQRLKIEEERFEAERTATKDRNALERRRVELEELRFTQEAKRDEGRCSAI